MIPLKDFKNKKLLLEPQTEESSSPVEDRRFAMLVRAGLADKAKIVQIRRALSKDTTKLTPQDKFLLGGILHKLIDVVDANTQIFAKVKQAVKEEASDLPDVPPPMLLFRRKAIRNFPNGKRVALYYSEKVDKYVSIPYDEKDFSDEDEKNVPVVEQEKKHFQALKGNLAEAAKPKKKKKKKKEPEGKISNLSRLGQIATEKKTGRLTFADGSAAVVDGHTAKAVHKVHGMLDDNNKVKWERMINKSKEGFLRVVSFSHGVHSQIAEPKKTK